MEQLGHSGHMAGEVSLGPLRHAFAAPGNEGILGEAGVGVLNFEEGKLDSSIREFVYQVDYFTLCPFLAGVGGIRGFTYLRYSEPSRHSPCSRTRRRRSPAGPRPRRQPTGRRSGRRRQRQMGEGH